MIKKSILVIAACTLSNIALSDSNWFVDVDNYSVGDGVMDLRVGKYLSGESEGSYAAIGIGKYSGDNGQCSGGKGATDDCPYPVLRHVSLVGGYKYNFWDRFFIKPELGLSYGSIDNHYPVWSEGLESEESGFALHTGFYTGVDLGDFSVSSGIKYISLDQHDDYADNQILLLMPLSAQWRF